ncbi:MAG: glycosyltransferase family 39 protein [Candidatus Acidiferrales bacterium]
MPTSSLFSPQEPRGRHSFVAPARRRFPSYLDPSFIWSSLRELQWPLFAIVAVAWYLRARDPHYSSAYMDESIYVLYGRMFLTRHFQPPIDHPLNFSFGWYLWPMLAAVADRIAGLVGVRELAAAMGAGLVCPVYGFARRLFSPAVGLASALIFAFLGPAILVSRIATRDIGSLFFFSIGLWLFVCAWQKEKEQSWSAWFAAALFMFAAFLCKYLIAIYFLFLVILALFKGRRAILGFFLPLVVLCAAYADYYREALRALLRYGSAYGSLKAPGAGALQIYFTHRWDFWILAVLAFAAWFSYAEVGRWKLALVWCGAALMPLFQIVSRADYDYWKHVNYSFLFLVPLAMQGLLSLLRRTGSVSYKIAGPVLVSCLAVAFGWMGYAWHIDQFVFWPNTEPVVAYFQGRLPSSARVLVDDTVLRYYFSPPLPQWQITDPFYFRYDSATGAPAYSAAVANGLFDYIVLDGGIGEDARQMAHAIAPQLSARYVLRVNMPDATLGQRIQIYERQNPPAAPAPVPVARIEIVAPASNALVQTNRTATTLRASVRDIAPGDYVLADVFTNRWYPQTGKLRPGAPDGDLSATIYLAGQGREQCYHIVRVRLFDPSGGLIDSALSFSVARANAGGSAPSCR